MHEKLRPVGEQEENEEVHASSVLTVRSATGWDRACPVKGRATRQLYKN